MKSCPRCARALEEIVCQGLTVDGCRGCGGIWFDPGELNRLAHQSEGGLMALESKFEPSVVQESAPVVTMPCPSCGGELFEFEFKHSPGIKLDGCRKCQGIWADDGELAAIHQRLAPEQAAPAEDPTSLSSPQEREKPPEAELPPAPWERGKATPDARRGRLCPSCGASNPYTSFTCSDCGFTLKKTPQGRSPEEWVSCPICRGPMLPLQDTELSRSGIVDYRYSYEFGDYLPGVSLLGALEFVWCNFKLGRLRSKYQDSPRSLVCPRCLEVRERR